MARTYNSPPLIEAVCEFRFTSSQPWDWTIPGMVYEQIRENFPTKEQVNSVSMKIDPVEGKAVQEVQPKMRFLSTDKTSLVQVAPDYISIHQLKPYTMWDHFKEQILKYFHIYWVTANPINLNRIGLRYVNQILLPYEDVELEDYFRVLPQVPSPIPQVFPSFLMQVDIPYDVPKSGLRIIFGTVQPNEISQLAYALDLDMYSLIEDVPTADNILEWLDIAHGKIETAFDAAFTERTHIEIFREVKK
jgi:uncharacterized protein (TIGR04255 family)